MQIYTGEISGCRAKACRGGLWVQAAVSMLLSCASSAQLPRRSALVSRAVDTEQSFKSTVTKLHRTLQVITILKWKAAQWPSLEGSWDGI